MQYIINGTVAGDEDLTMLFYLLTQDKIKILAYKTGNTYTNIITD